MNTIQLIRDLSNACGASGYEDDVVKIVRKYAGGLCVSCDAMLNTLLRFDAKDEGKPSLMLDAHLDEVAFMVQAIEGNGLLKVLPLGGWVVENVAAQIFTVQTKHEYIKGIVASKPPHFMTQSEREKKLSFEDLKLDVGATSRDEVINDYKIRVGNPVIPYVNFEVNEKNGTMLGKAFDNRLGCAAVLKTLEHFQDEAGNLPVELVGALASQEEVGTRGAEITTRKVKPKLAIVFEGSPSDDFFTDEFNSQGALGKGVQIRIKDNSYISHYGFLDFAVRTAEQEKIPYQLAVRSGGSTNAGVIHRVTEAVPVLVLGIPVRYAHTHYCYAKLSDFQNTVNLAIAIIKNINSFIADLP
ncbi:MAG: M20/M25/M40 family metallo-hydrolase [Treponemataceae bacterium]